MEIANACGTTFRVGARLAPWGFCLATFAGGVWSVSQSLQPRATAEVSEAAGELPTSTATESAIQQLFSATPNRAGAGGEPLVADVERVAVPRTAALAGLSATLSETAAGAAGADSTIPRDPTVADQQLEEIARGQEPGSPANPLRSSAGGGAGEDATEATPPRYGEPSDAVANEGRYAAAPGASETDRYGAQPFASPAEAFQASAAESPAVGAQPLPTAAPPAALPLPIPAPLPAPAALPVSPGAAPPASPHSLDSAAAPPAPWTRAAGEPRAAVVEPPPGAASPSYRTSASTSRAAQSLPVRQEAATPTPGLAPSGGPAALATGTGRPGEMLLEGVQSPVLTLQKLAPAEIQVGKKCSFAVRVRNTGNRAAHDVEVWDEVPQGTQLLGTSPRADVLGSEVAWKLGSLSPGEERVVEMELLPADEGELGSVARVAFAAQASAKARCTRPALTLRLSAGPQVMAGQTHRVQVEVANPGSGDATGVTLLENVPEGVSHEAGPALEFVVGTLRAGETRRLELSLTAEQAGVVHNVMTARADANLEVQAEAVFEVVAPELQVAIDGPQKRYLERPATYQVSIENPGTASARDVQLVTKLPRGMQFVSANNMGEYDAATHSVYWSLAELPPSERGVVELVALPLQPGEQRLEASTKAEQGLEDRAETNVLVEGIEAVKFEVVDVDDPIEAGDETLYEIRVANQGSKEATNVQVAAQLEPGLRPIDAQGDARHSLAGDRVLFEALPRLAPKAEASFRIRAQGVAAGDQRIRVQVTTDAHQQPITKEESTRVYADR